MRERIHTSERIALQVRIGDVGTSAAIALADTISRLADARLGTSYRHRIVGQWWLAQLGTASLLRDMLVSFVTSALLVLPILVFALRSWRQLLIAVPANMLPMLAALAAIGWTGITLRVGTALVLAIALAIAVDDSIHLLTRAHEERQRGAGPRRAMRTALAESGVALTATTLVLVAGFLSMLTSDLAAIRDMGVVAAIALTAALLADLLLLPALYVLLEPRGGQLRNPAPAHTSSVRSHPGLPAARLAGRAGL